MTVQCVVQVVLGEDEVGFEIARPCLQGVLIALAVPVPQPLGDVDQQATHLDPVGSRQVTPATRMRIAQRSGLERPVDRPQRRQLEADDSYMGIWLEPTGVMQSSVPARMRVGTVTEAAASIAEGSVFAAAKLATASIVGSPAAPRKLAPPPMECPISAPVAATAGRLRRVK